MKNLFRTALPTLMAALVSACGAPSEPSPEQLQALFDEKPEILLDALEKEPEKLMEVIQSAAREQKRLIQERQLEQAFTNPKTPVIDENRVVFGNPEAAITIVEYSDFECPYCARVNPVIERILVEYSDTVRVIYKHLPLDFHKLAMPAARYYEAIALQKPEQVKAFHDVLFQEPQVFKSGGEKFLRQTAEDLGVDMDRLAQDLESEQVIDRINADMAEGRSFGFNGTPAFLINGVPLSGAKPYEAFKQIIDRHLEGG